MRNIKLDAEEKEILEAIERDEFVPVSGKELCAVADAVAARKKKIAHTKGIPYQSYLSEVIHHVAIAA